MWCELPKEALTSAKLVLHILKKIDLKLYGASSPAAIRN